MLSMTRKDIRAYSSEYGYAQMMFCGAGDDYAAGRCLAFNSMFDTGYPLFCQSIEKFLKAIIYIETGAKPSAKGSNRHNPYALKEELKRKSTTDYDLDKYDEVFIQLFGHFQHRYHDNINQSRCMSGNEVDQFDELWMHLFERLKFPTEVKYRLKFLAMLFDDHPLKLMPSYRYWVTFNNKAMRSKLGAMEDSYKAVLEHFNCCPS